MQRIVILGAGESGTGAAILAKEKGFDVFVSDFGTIKDTYRALLDQNGIAWEDGKHTEELILNADEVVKSPGTLMRLIRYSSSLSLFLFRSYAAARCSNLSVIHS